MKRQELESILELHRKWLYNEDGGKRADLTGAYLRSADLTGADLRSAYLRSANLTGADLTGADLGGAKNNEYALAQTEIVPREGEFVGWKKAYKQVGIGLYNNPIYDACIVKLLIPHDAQRSNATGRKCRASKAKVLSIETFNGYPFGIEACSNYDAGFVYRVGQTVEVDNFDTDRLNECAPGVHFFITREEAENY